MDWQLHGYPAWAPRIWHGMPTQVFLSMLAQHGFRIHPRRLGMAGMVSLFGIFNLKMGIAQRALYGRDIERTRLAGDPIFIVGHWRSGTTYLHELLAADPRFWTPNTYECLAPTHFLLTEPILPHVLKPLLPSRRPMDNVRVDWFGPQEDEFALCNMGLPSPYRRMAFPNQADLQLEYLDMLDLPAEQIDHWSRKFLQFLQAVTLRHPKRLVLKSPTHTGRIWLLNRLFPHARFIHVVRDPRRIFPSTVQLWRTLDEVQAFQIPHHRQLVTYIMEAYRRMYRGFDQGAAELRPGQLSLVRYEELVRNPLQVLQRVYRELELGDFGSVRGAIEQVVSQKQGYATNRYQLSEEDLHLIDKHWGDYLQRYGYAGASSTAAAG
jgi:hypothetical protein